MRHRDSIRLRRLAHVLIVIAESCERFADLVYEFESRLARIAQEETGPTEDALEPRERLS